uniref:Peptidase_M13 domain-containing protein n=1 Tax=Parastrongyloides trichosuri TaxID=131310 RepID=A0A0N4ZXD0_PARTI
MIYFKRNIKFFFLITTLYAISLDAVFFVYPKTPIELIEKARSLGTNQRILLKSYLNSKNKNLNIDEENEAINQFLNKCHDYSRNIGYDEEYVNFLKSVAVSELDNSPTIDSHFHHSKILDLMSLDDATISFLTTPIQGMKKILQRQCLINEIDFQCVDSFFGSNKDVTTEKIDIIRWSGGFAKLMLDEECPNNGEMLNDYNCIGINAKEYGRHCTASLKAYNNTKFDADHKIINIFVTTISEIEKYNDLLEKTNDPEEHTKIKRDSEILLTSALKKITNFEASKCRMFNQLNKCLKSSVKDMCGRDAARKFDTMSKIGYLRRERFNDINDAFLALNMEPHRSCINLY